MKRLYALLCLLGAVSLGVASCGEEENDPLKNRDGFCDEWAVEACNTTIVEDCSSGDKERCRSAQAEFCRGLVDTDDYSRDGAKDCIAAVGKAYVDGRLTAEERESVGVLGYLGGECESVVSGSRLKGASCNKTGDCDTASGLRCLIPLGETSGKCYEPEIKSGGAKCGQPQQVCEPGLYCNGSNCVERQGKDDSCDAVEAPCMEDFKCVIPEPEEGEEASEQEVCVAKAGDGDKCESDADCVSGFICAVPGSKTCVESVRVDRESELNLCKSFR